VKVAALSTAELHTQLSSRGIYLRTGPFLNHIQSSVSKLAECITLLYADYTLHERAAFADFHVTIARPASLRRWFRPQIRFLFDGRTPFKPLPAAHAFPILEWGLNWCVSSHANQYLIFHAAVAAKAGRAVILPGEPGTGKSTLCAALVTRGWRLLSDELTLISLDDACVTPVPRPISLKNASIDVMRCFSPGTVIGPVTHDTTKGTVAHMKPPVDSIERSTEPAVPAWIIFPKYVPNAPVRLHRETRGRAFMRIARNSFNYSVLGASGFKTLTQLIDRCDCYDFSYGDLDQAVAVFDSLEPPTEVTLTRARV
jgi:HprK-related kinase A